VHGLGHALLRAYHGDIGQAVRACRNLPRNFAPDCAQGVFHDYWISLRGADGTTAPRRRMSPRTLCDGRLTYIRPCWYRYFLEQPLSSPCAMQRICAVPAAGCVPLNATAASARLRSQSLEPFDQMRVCAELRAADARACLRGVPDQALAGHAAQQLRLIRDCAHVAAGAQSGCYEWLGRTLAVVTNGLFRERGCTKLSPARGGHARPAQRGWATP